MKNPDPLIELMIDICRDHARSLGAAVRQTEEGQHEPWPLSEQDIDRMAEADEAKRPSTLPAND